MAEKDAVLGMAESYNVHSEQQRVAINLSKSYIRLAIESLEIDCSKLSPLIVADFGVAHGANSASAIQIIGKYLRKIKNDKREPLIIYNDLPTNDWKYVFDILENGNSHNGVISARSFYKQCLPKSCLSIGYSSSALQWLSKLPCNLSDHCDVELAQDFNERDAFKRQAYHDYRTFLKFRSLELLPGAVLILVIIAANNQGESGYAGSAELLYECARRLPLSPKELHEYTMPSYCRSYSECIDQPLFAKYSFDLIKSQMVSVQSPLYQEWKSGRISLKEFTHKNTQSVRSWSESILEQVLIKNDRPKHDIPHLLDQFYNFYEYKTEQEPNAHANNGYFVYIVLKKKQTIDSGKN